MKLKEIIEKLQLRVLTGQENLDAEVTGGYTSDLLSDEVVAGGGGRGGGRGMGGMGGMGGMMGGMGRGGASFQIEVPGHSFRVFAAE